MANVSDVVDIIVPVTPTGAVKDPMELPAELRTPSILNPLSSDDLIARMDAHGIAQSILPARKYGPEWGVDYAVMRDYVAQQPGRLFATAGICPLSKGEGVRRFDEAVRDFGFVGAHCYTSWSGLPIDHRLWYPYYAKAEELGVPFQIEVMGGKTRPSHGRPEYLDQVADDFPDLKIVATHVGYPWERDLIGMTEFRENLYIGYDGMQPRLWSNELLEYAHDRSYAGYALTRFGGEVPEGRLPSDRILFGSNYLSMDIDTAFDEIEELGFDEKLRRKLYTTNARRLYQLPEVA
jgi:uncharacterized protein